MRMITWFLTVLVSIEIRTVTLISRNPRVEAVNQSKTGSFDEVNKLFSANGYSDLRPVHVSIVKRYIAYGHVERYLQGKSFLNPK